MTKRPEGQVIILSESDADVLVGRLSDLAELVWETLERRRVVLRAPHGSRSAKVIPLRQPAAADRAPLDELF